MAAPALVATASLHGALVAAMLTASPLVRAFHNLARNFGIVKITQVSPAFPKIQISCLTSHRQRGRNKMRLLAIFLGVVLVVGYCSGAGAASQKAMSLRQANGLTAFKPPPKFLSGNFVADEMNPAFIFGPVQAFAASRKCPTTWLIEAGDQNRLAGPGTPMEYTVYLEEDCPDQVVYYVFIDQSGLTPQQWIEWRRKFHGQSKTDPEYSEAKSKLDTACKAGCGVGAELRFIQKNGELVNKSPEAVLLGDLHYAPIYDLNLQKKISR
jgi:hypothetical protein